MKEEERTKTLREKLDELVHNVNSIYPNLTKEQKEKADILIEEAINIRSDIDYDLHTNTIPNLSVYALLYRDLKKRFELLKKEAKLI